MAKGKLIVIEGLDGCGKNTHTKILCSKLKNLGKSIHKISFPDYSQPSSSLVKMYLNSEFGDSPSLVNAYAASSFFAVDRYANYIKFWKNRHDSGQIILANRYSTSNAAYNLAKLPEKKWDFYLEWLEDYEYNKLELPKPDVVIYLDMPIEASQKFISKRYKGKEYKKDLHEKNIKYLLQCRKTALYTAKKLNWIIIPCSINNKVKKINDINEEIITSIKDVVF